MLDHSAGEISNQEAAELIKAVAQEIETDALKLYPGVSYRHLLVWKDGPFDFDLTPPHDILGKAVGPYLPKGPYGDFFLDLIQRAMPILDKHPINQMRKVRGVNPANSIWLWGEGKKPRLDSFKTRYGLEGAVISAVDLIFGIGILAGLRPVHVEGATGTIHTNFEGKAQAALEVLKGKEDFLYLHVEAPDECSHQGDLQGKIRSLELIDQKVLSPIFQGLKEQGEPFRIMVLPDHPTPLALRTHVAEPVPFLIYDSRTASQVNRAAPAGPRAASEPPASKSEAPLVSATPLTATAAHPFSEAGALASGRAFSSGPKLMRYFITGKED